MLSLDTDFADYWLLEKLLKAKILPRIIIHEVNREQTCVSTIKLNGLAYWDNVSAYFGASVCAFYCLARQFNYSMVYCEKTGVNCFWVRNDILRDSLYIDAENLQRTLTPDFLYRPSKVSLEPSSKMWHNIEKCF